MFDLEQAIAAWRRQIMTSGIGSPSLVDELESHLREDVEQRQSAGLVVEQAFDSAVSGIGPPQELHNEFAKLGGVVQDRALHFLTILSGSPGLQPATNMNSSPSNPQIEPAWATYIRAATYLAPVLGLCTFAVVLIVPKIQEICEAAGVSAPGSLRVMFFVVQHWLLIAGMLVLALAALEWCSPRWLFCRRAAVGIGIFVLNTAVLIFIGVLLVVGMTAASALLHHTN